MASGVVMGGLGGQSHPQSVLRKNYKAKTTYSIHNIHIAHYTALIASSGGETP